MSMSVNVQEAAVAEILLNPDQIERIIRYAVANGLYDGPEPTDPEMRRTDAATLVYQARRARDNGNTSDHVKEICFVADVDQGALTPAAPASDPFAPPAASAPAAAETNGSIDDISTMSDQDLAKIIEGLMPNASIPVVAAEIERCRAEQLRRQSAQGQAEVPPPAQVPASTPEQAPLPLEPPPAPLQPPPAAGVLPEGTTDAEGQPRPRADASGDAVPEAAGAGAEGGADEAVEDAQARRRTELEAQVSGQLLLAYGKTFADVAQIPTEDLERMVANPGGPVQPEPQISPERAKLEEQVTGPMLKAWGRGRVDVINLSDEELAEMVAYPGGPTTRPGGEAFVEQPVQPAQPALVTPTVPPRLPQQASASTADEIISREKFPIAPEVEQPPELPFDISRISDEELRSVHAQFHAVLARVNWILAQHRDEIYVSERALTARKVEAREALPKMVENKRLTRDEAAAMVASDLEVVRLEAEVAERKHPLIKLEAIAENARSTCARCSREWSMRKGESDPVVRGER